MSRSKNEILLAASAFILLAAAISAAFALRFSPDRAGSIIQYTSSHSGGIDINSADKEELTALDGIGEKKAENIIGYREEHGELSVGDNECRRDRRKDLRQNQKRYLRRMTQKKREERI